MNNRSWIVTKKIIFILYSHSFDITLKHCISKQDFKLIIKCEKMSAEQIDIVILNKCLLDLHENSN